MVAFIGPNGAGKSTTIKMITSILYPDKGKISVLGLNPEKDRKKLEQVVQNETAVNQLLEDFFYDDMIIKEMNYYNLTDTVLRVELQCEIKKEVKTYLIMIDNKNPKWETYVTGFI